MTHALIDRDDDKIVATFDSPGHLCLTEAVAAYLKSAGYWDDDVPYWNDGETALTAPQFLRRPVLVRAAFSLVPLPKPTPLT